MAYAAAVARAPDRRTMARHQPYYCEENVWWLAQEASLASLAREVVIITNASRAVVMLHQRAAPAPGAPIGWDYHVVLATRDDAGAAEVHDLDCVLGSRLPARRWLDASFALADRLPRSYLPRFRVVPAEEYVATFCSDRSHMRDRRGRLRRPPPPWPCIGAGEPNLERFLDLDDVFIGEVLELDALAARWAERGPRSR